MEVADVVLVEGQEPKVLGSYREHRENEMVCRTPRILFDRN